MTKFLLHSIDHHRGFSSLFWHLQNRVSSTKYYKNIQTIISKSDFRIWQHDLETHDGITTRPL